MQHSKDDSQYNWIKFETEGEEYSEEFAIILQKIHKNKRKRQKAE